MWQVCPTCEQDWTGPLYFEMCRTRSRLSAGRPQDDLERLTAALGLVEALTMAGQFEEARRLGPETHEVLHRAHGPEHPLTLRSANVLGAALAASGDHEAALPLMTEAVATSRRIHADDIEETLNAIGTLAVTHQEMGDYHLALPLYQEALDARR